ncbi:MAG: ribonuclease H-like domain-containing protein, partial [Candidatus Tectomicrobia bacterium]|nr:ribonuclease H-like domain-containing protein [Candidatus Tectomicrobia bacterium]
ADGLIVVDRHISVSDRHGNRVLRSSPWFNPPGIGQPFHVKHVVFMDTETTGLAGGTGTLVFLLGLACIEDETLHLRQLFLTEFGGETALLQAASDWIGTRKHLVTFNGKSFDAPLMATRYRLARLPDPFAPMHHVDLFHPTRRAFANHWPDCRLQTAEKRLLGFSRVGDLPSYEIPDVWFAFMRHGSTDRLTDILTHNRFDLLSLVTLLPSLAEAFNDPGTNGADVVSIARYYRQQGDEDAALTHLQQYQKRLGEQGLLDLAWMYRRRRNWEPAISIWEHLAQRQCVEAIERLAKYHEHVRRDYQSALELTRQLKLLDRQQSAHRQRERRLRVKLSR